MEQKNIGCYMRYNSSENLGSKIKEMCDYAQSHNCTVEKNVTERRSGIEPLSDEFYNLIENPNIDIIIVPSISCITRNYLIISEVEQKVRALKKSVISLDGSYI